LVCPQTDFADASVFNYVVRVKSGRRGALATHLKDCGIDTGIHWLPGNRFSLFKDCRGANAIPVTDQVGDEILTLPLWSYMTEETILTIANTVRGYFERDGSITNPGDTSNG
jgi:dTDP-4-amino-4,6-dideoxygalactose transaminase